MANRNDHIKRNEVKGIEKPIVARNETDGWV
jgi:hypothetical protein